MAKKAKDSALSMEERLEQALIPNWDEPYQLPDNWCWTKFKSCSSIKTGKKDANYGTENGAYPFFTCAAEPIRCDNYSFDCYAILLAGNGDIGNISIYDGKFEAYQRTYVVEVDKSIDTLYAYYYFKYKWEDYNKDKMFGTAIPYIRMNNLQDFPFPIAPITEQQHIVERIESLFTKLDEAKEKAQKVVDGFETRKAAILHKAFSGELTAKWRKNNLINFTSWKEKSIGELFTHTTGKALKKSDTNGTLRRYITTSNLYWGKFDFSEVREMYFTTDELEKCTAQKGDLLICNGGDIGRSAIWKYDYEICLQNHISKLRPKADNIDVVFFFYYFMNAKIKGNINGKGIGISSLSAKDLLSMKVMLPSLIEQKEIVRILNNIFIKEESSRKTAEAVIEQIATMKKAILSLAFRGELGTNDPTEESAVELLKNILIDG